ncbi:MAG TPA: aminotransferase class I/II-fold pyridoxal phosphate-dependent enzyme [Firmicutes bacterium]|nr:aminotransferase class I/II-fold pyridoxal phosphate-dependent enzyme [Bacillota bacterium]
MLRDDLEEMKDFSVYPGSPRAKMDQNESPFPFSDRLRGILASHIKQYPFHRYLRPERLMALKESLAAYTGADPAAIAIGAGADALIQSLIAVSASGQGNVFCFHPTYPLYQLFARVLNVPSVSLPLLKPDFSFDIEKAEKLIEKSAIAFITYPNNPTGNLFEKEMIMTLIRSHPHCEFVLDEAYYEYSGQTFVPEVPNHPNLTVVRTFSKFFSIPSLRLGYLIGRPEIVSAVEKAQFVPYNVSAFSVETGIVILENRSDFEKDREGMITQREELMNCLKTLPHVRAYPSYGNFIFISFPPGKNPARALYDKGIYVRDFSNIAGYEDFIRITVGRPSENRLFFESLKSMIKKKGK